MVVELSERHGKRHGKRHKKIDLFFRLALTPSNMTHLYYYKKKEKERKTKSG